jgi:hypothetical protein
MTMTHLSNDTPKQRHTQAMTATAAAAAAAAAAARYWLILAERLLRQWIATPALGRGPRFVQFLSESAAADPGLATAVKLTM